MADRYFIDGLVTSDWGTTPLTNWATTSGGAGGASVPTNADAVFFDANSPNCTVNASGRTALSLNFTGYTNTITMSQIITVSGSVTLSATMTIAGASGLIVSAASTLTSNGKTWPNPLTLQGNVTHTLADNWDVNGLLTTGTGAVTVTINGAQISAGAGVTWGSTAGVVGTTLLILDGTGTFTPSAGASTFRLPLTINAPGGTITFTGIPFLYNTGTFTYIAGTVIITAGFELRCNLSTTFDIAPITLLAVVLSGTSQTFTFTSNLNVSGLLSLGGTTSSITLTGSAINASGGIRHAGTTGVISGTTILNVTGTGTLDGPSVTTGRIDSSININAPGGTVTIDNLFKVELSQLLFTAGTVITDMGTWASGSSGGMLVHPGMGGRLNG